MKKNIGYVRVSSEKQVGNKSLPAQERLILEYCSKHNIENVEIIKDPGRSARSMKRGGIQEVLKQVRSGEVEKLIVTESDRMNRNVKDQNILAEECENYGVDLIGVIVPIDMKTPEGKLLFNITGSVNQYDSDQKSRKSKTGLVQKIIQGQYPHGSKVPYGYRKNKAHYLVAVKSELEHVKSLFDYFVYENYSVERTIEQVESDYGIELPKTNLYLLLESSIYNGKVKSDDKEYNILCEYLEKDTEEELNRFLVSEKRPNTRLEPVITEQMREDMHMRKTVFAYSKHDYKYRNIVFINGEKAFHEKQTKQSGKEYWYYYIKSNGKSFYVNQTKIDTALRKSIGAIKENEYETYSEKIHAITKSYVTEQITEEKFMKLIKKEKRKYLRLNREFSRIDIVGTKKSYEIFFKK